MRVIDREDAGRVVRGARLLAGMSLGDVAAATGSDRPSLSRLESGAHEPRLLRLCDVLHAVGFRLVAVPADAEIVPERASSCPIARIELVTYPFPADWMAFSGRSREKNHGPAGTGGPM